MRPLARRYSLMLLDLWGVMHNGVEIFPHAKECLQKLRAEGGKGDIRLQRPPQSRGHSKPAALVGLGGKGLRRGDILRGGGQRSLFGKKAVRAKNAST